MAVEVETALCSCSPGPVPSVIPTSYDLADLGYVEEEYLLEGQRDVVRAGRRAHRRRPLGGRRSRRARAYRTRSSCGDRSTPRRSAGRCSSSGSTCRVGSMPRPTGATSIATSSGAATRGSASRRRRRASTAVAWSRRCRSSAWHPTATRSSTIPATRSRSTSSRRRATAVRGANGVSLLGALEPTLVLASGESQSAIFLVTYINAIDARARVFDGFFIHGRGAVGAGFGGPHATGAAELAATAALSEGDGEEIRSDARVPVIVVQSETDVVFMRGGAAQPGRQRSRAAVGDRRRRARRHLHARRERGRRRDAPAGDARGEARTDRQLHGSAHGRADQRRTPAALRGAGRARAPAAVGGRWRRARDRRSTRGRRRRGDLARDERRHRDGRRAHAVGRRSDQRALRPRPERWRVRDPVRHDALRSHRAGSRRSTRAGATTTSSSSPRRSTARSPRATCSRKIATRSWRSRPRPSTCSTERTRPLTSAPCGWWCSVRGSVGSSSPRGSPTSSAKTSTSCSSTRATRSSSGSRSSM